MHSGVKGNVCENSKFKCETCINQQTNIVEDYPGIE